MKYEFKGRTLREAVHNALAKGVSHKQIPEAWAPPLIWGRWYPIMDVWTGPGGNVHINVTFNTISEAPSAFEVQIGHGSGKKDVLSSSGPGSETYVIPHLPDYSGFATTLYLRARSFTTGQILDVQTNYDIGRNRAENEKLYVWTTELDDKVRPSHAANHGKIFSWDNPPDTGHPGEDYGCRCRAKPLLDQNK